MTNVRQAHRPEHGIGNRVAKHIGIGMTFQSMAVRNRHATQHKRAVFRKSMHIVANSNHDFLGIG
jgi:hypothetical protein